MCLLYVFEIFLGFREFYAGPILPTSRASELGCTLLSNHFTNSFCSFKCSMSRLARCQHHSKVSMSGKNCAHSLSPMRRGFYLFDHVFPEVRLFVMIRITTSVEITDKEVKVILVGGLDEVVPHA